MNKLSEVTEQLYETFSPYRVGDDFIGCDCCVSSTKSALLVSKPLRMLAYDDLEHYSWSAMSTWGEVRHFKYFLPRLLELAIEHRDDFLDLAVMFGKLAYARWHSWPPREVVAVDRFLQAYWAYQLSLDIDSPFDDVIDTVLCAEGCALESVESQLVAWVADDSSSARKHLAAFVLCNERSLLSKRRLSNAFWNAKAKPHGEVLRWLVSPEVAAFLDDGVLPKDFDPARSQLEAIRAALEQMST